MSGDSFLFIEELRINNVVLVSSVQQRDPGAFFHDRLVHGMN